MAAAGGGGFTGIDPQVFGQMLRSLSSGTSGAQPLASYYLARFNTLGVETGAVRKLLQDYSWAEGQQPMLHRRYTLASALDQAPGNYFNGMTSAGAGILEYPTSQAAQQAGAKAAQEYEDGKISFKQFMSLLGRDDPDFDTGAVRKLGTNGLRDVEAEMFSASGTGTSPYLKVVAGAVSAAIANGVSFSLSPETDDGVTDFDLLANLLPDASYPPKVLVGLANMADQDGSLTSGPKQVTAVLTALAQSPGASAEFINQFPQTHHGMAFAQYIGGWNPYMSEPGLAQLYANIVTSGTIGAKSIDPKLAAQNVTALVQYYSGSSAEHTVAPVQLAYAKIIASYWTDVQASISDPYYVKSPDGISLNASQWQAFVGEAMQNPTAAVNLLHFSATEAALLATNNPDNPEAQHASGLINGFFGAEAQQVYQNDMNQLQQEEADWDKVANLFAGIALNPEGAPGAVLNFAVTSLADSAVNAVLSSSSKITAPSVETWQQEWQLAAAESYENDHAIGDPAGFARQYHATAFLTPQGTLVSNATLAQQQAYDAWLKSPAVANASDQRYLNLDDGRVDGETGGK